MECVAYLNWIRKQPCAVCNDDTVIHAHHLKGGEDGGIALKEWDVTAIPLCPFHHRELHQKGYEAFELQYGITQAEIVVRMFKKAFYEGIVQIVPAKCKAA